MTASAGVFTATAATLTVTTPQAHAGTLNIPSDCNVSLVGCSSEPESAQGKPIRKDGCAGWADDQFGTVAMQCATIAGSKCMSGNGYTKLQEQRINDHQRELATLRTRSTSAVSAAAQTLNG
ncbi:hypothetical protein RKE30_26395 [Streptomyces sp. Li-HN-5-11]|uniref:hypothetical protein n=1 Tax=Streptomyces sp. Li-HN-5-11 TaxID=3075432 RepID=UPI0028A8B03C|nr:hypothetical protein [Streptomyces sp. Li-HN-5-11]WNM33667.1 hypothetical protein RKE30_26395 [Streptomyces sp. Li-HN-5-11]